MRWGCTGSLDMLDYKVSTEGTALFLGFLDLSRSCESLDGMYEEGLVVGWSTSIGYDDEVLAIPKDRLEN